MQLRTAAFAVVLLGCGKREPTPTGRLCLAANPADVFVWDEPKPDGTTEKVDYLAGKPTAIRFRKQTYPQPGGEVGFPDAKEGELVELVREGKVVDSFRVKLKRLGPDLCYYFRAYRDPQRKAGWILDTDREKDRCNCFPWAGSGSAAPGSG